MKTIVRKRLKVRCPVCKSLLEIEPNELEWVGINHYLNDEYWKSKLYKSFLCSECGNRAYYRGFHWGEWAKDKVSES